MPPSVHRFYEEPLHFAYRRRSENNEHKATFHSHLGIELLLIHQGRGTMIVNNNSYEIKPGMVCIFQPYQLHHLTLDYSDGQAFERSLAIFEPTMYDSYFETWPTLHAFFNHLNREQLPFPCIYGIDENHLLVHLFRTMHEKLPSLTETNQSEEISLFLVTLFQALRPLWTLAEGSETALPTSRNNHQVENILRWIESNYASPYRLEELSQALHLSPYHLAHLFKEATGISITEYISARRIHQSIQLLTTSNKPISLIAEEIGLSNTSYFCKLFKEHMGSTPHQYRKKWVHHTFRLR
ncbi:AraC family transcriptional regulator [Cohnella fermenti]|uniref:AraC family transcriptional regulator n=1 Tax=Cohnella fermenti TaxID=2565925 RepID=A0A4S4BNV5_9BACL|nr:AraC family transcriptional regulator [Cohnella fermenti]THF76389.1 AraC family transcriptional regulator [Cohnella fermenti]